MEGKGVDGAGRLVELDRRLDAVLLTRESRLASAQVGTQLLRNACDLYPASGLHAFLAAPTPHHAAVVFGAVAAALDVPAGQAAETYAFQHVRGLVAAAQRLVRLGQRDAQRILHALKPAVRDAVERAGTIPVEAAGAFAPLWDVAAMAHERAPVRLFVS